jgi:DNA-binding IclR family transcriptional regulator
LARPVLQELSRTIGETVDLSVLQGRSAMFVDQVVGASRLVAISGVGEAFPLYCTANGKALLACLPPERRQNLLTGPLRRLTPATITDKAALERQISSFARDQLAYDLEEHSEGIAAVGTSFIDPLGRDFAISTPVPASRFAAKRVELGKRLLAARAEIIKRIPGSRAPVAQPGV